MDQDRGAPVGKTGSYHSIINQAKLYLLHEHVLGSNREDGDNILSSIIKEQASTDLLHAFQSLRPN